MNTITNPQTLSQNPMRTVANRLRTLPIILVLFLSLISGLAIAQTTYTSTGAGNWTTMTWSPAGSPGPGDDVIINTNVTVNTNVQINNLTVNASRTLTIGNSVFSVDGATSISGIVTDNNAGGSNSFNGTLTVNPGGTLTSASTSPYLFGNDIVNNGTFNKANTGNSTLDASLSISGANTLTFNGGVTISADAVIASTATVTMTAGALNGSNAGSTWINGSGATLNYNNAVAPMAAGSFDASASNNTVNYNGTAQAVRDAAYFNLNLTGSGTKTLPDVSIAGNLTRTGITMAFSGSTITFDGSSAATYTFNASQTFPNVVVNKAGGSLTFVPSATGQTTTFASLTVSGGTLSLGSINTTLTVQGDLSGAGGINVSGATHTINLGGVSNAIGTYTTSASTASSTVNYNRAGDQSLFASANYKSITLSGSGEKSLSGVVICDGVLNFSTSVKLVLGANDIKLRAGATLLPAAAGSWNASRMVVTEGSGKFIKEGTTTAHFTTNLPGGRFPIGSNGFYTPMTLTSLTSTFTGTGAILVRAVPTRQPNVPYFNNALIKYWDVETSNMSAINATVSFNFSSAEVIGSVALYAPRLWDGATLSTVTSPSTPGSNPFSSTGTTNLTGEWTAMDPTVRTSLYSYQSGDWNDPNTWTTDPSGSTLVSPIVPGAGDQVVILNGRTVTTAIGRTVGSLTIQDGGTLDIGTTTGNSFGVVDGAGTLRLSSVNVPTGAFAQFVSSAGGTFEYYNLPAGTNALATSLTTYNNLVVSSSNATSYTLTMGNSNYTLNGNFSIQKTSTGAPTFHIGGTTGNRTLNVLGNVTVDLGTTLGVAVYNGSHALNISGNLTVNGTIDLQNGAAWTNSTSGEAVITFLGATENTQASFGASAVADFYDFRVNKNEGYELFVTASPSSNVEFNGNGQTINPILGTLRLGANITVPRLNGPSGGNYDLGAPGVLPVLWIDGANVTDGGVSGAIVPYGTVRITAGSLTVQNGQRGIVLRESGLLKIEGGVVNLGTFRTSVTAVTHRGSFDMSGGTLNMLGNGTINYYAVFSLPYPENVFRMTGGTINITKTTSGGIAANGGILIASSPQNYFVTGGTVNANITGNSNFDITSTAPFYNFNIGKLSSGTGTMRLDDINWSYDGSAGNTATASGQALVILNDLNITATGSPTLLANEQDVVVGGNFNVAAGAELRSGSNSTVFNGNAAQQFTINGSVTFASSGGASFVNGPENIIPGANWTFENLSSASNAAMDPNSLMTAESLTETAANGIHRFYSPIIPTSGPVTASLFVKPNGRTCVSLQLGDFGSLAIARFNLTASGSVVSTNAGIVSASITAEANGWYRISATSTGHPNYRMRFYVNNGSCADSYVGNASLGVYVWGAKLESGSTASPYVSSTGLGVNSLELNKAPGSTLTLNGSVSSITVAGNLRVNTGIFNLSGKTVNVNGNVVNNTQVTGTGASKLRLNGTSNQTISGNGLGSFLNLTIDNTGGAAGDATVAMLADFTVESQLEMVSQRLFFIDNKRLTLPAAATIVATTTPFGALKFIQTQGFLSDGGISKTYSPSASSFVFPFGSGSNYTPATLAFATAPTTYGTVNMRPVAAQQLYVTDPAALPQYWKVSTSGFTGIAPGSMNLTFNYGTLPDNIAYIPGYYNFAEIAYTTVNDITAVNEATKLISFTSFSKLDGDFTAGVPAAFGVVVPYYSRANGNWNTPSTWSNDPVLKHTGAASGSIPSGSVPVFVGNGTSAFHTVTVTTNSTLAGSLIVDAGSTLDLGVTTGNNFGALPYSTAGGAGKLRINSSNPIAEFPAGDFGIFFTPAGGTTEYYSTTNAFLAPQFTAVPTAMQIRTYRNLNLNPSATSNITMADSDVEIYENITVNGNAAGTARFTDLSSRLITLRGNLNVTSGTLEFGSSFDQAIAIDGNIVIANAGTFSVANTGTALHTISLSGGITNNGTINFNQASKVNLNMIGNTSKSISGTNGAAVTNLSKLTLDKGTSPVILLNVDVAGTLTAPSNNWLTLVNGTFRLSKAASLILTDQPGSNFIIPFTSALSVNHIGANVSVANVASDDADLILAGRLEVLNGTFNVGSIVNNNHNDIEYAPTNVPEIVVSGAGVLNVNGQIRRSTGVFLGSLSYTQTGNSTVLVRGRNAEGASSFNLNRAKFEVLNSGSQFNMADNSLLIIDRTGVPSGIFGDVYLAPSAASVTGGEIRIGTSNTPPAESNFSVNSLVAFWNFTVDGTVTSKTVNIVGNPVSFLNNLSILNSSVFNTNGLNVNIGGGLINQNPNAAAGLNVGGYRALNATQVTTFSGLVGSPSITGASGNLTNFANVVLSNAFLGGAYNVSANSNLRINGSLQILNGTLNGADNIITVTGNVLNNRFHTSVAPGYMVLAGSIAQTISGNGLGEFGNIRINNAAGVELLAPARINGDLNFVAGLFYINNHQLTLGQTATVTGTLNQSSMIRLNGVLSDGGVKKLYPASAHDFTFPIGVTLKYSPARIQVTSNSTAGEVVVKPINTRHPATTDPLAKELTYYWNTSATGFNPATTINHTYTYQNTDAVNGDENLYRAGRYFNNIWVPQFGIPASVNAAANTINLSGVNYFNGDYTAGEQSEFDQLLVYYSRNATTGGNWEDPNAWSTDAILMHAGAPASSAPAFNSVVIAAGHTIVVTTDNRSAATAEVNGLLSLGSTIGHNLGAVTGTGTIRMTPTVSNQYIFPGGSFGVFVNPGGGTIEYNSSVASTLPSQATYNNIVFSGSGTKSLFNTDLVINGNMTIQAGIVANPSNRNVSLKGNLTNNSGVSGFSTGTGVITLSGVDQTITGSTSFNRLTINGAGIKSLNSSILVNTQLVLTQGIIETGSNVVSLLSSGTVLGGSSASYVNGNFQKYIATATASKSFEIGDASNYAPVNLVFSGTTNGVGSITANTSNGDHPNAATSGFDPAQSINRSWAIQNSGVTGFTSASATFTFNASDADLGVNTSNLSIARYASSTWTPASIGTRTATTTQAVGLTTFGEFQLAEPFSAGITWTGAVNSDWNNPGNWNPNIIPGGSDNITIPVVANQPGFLTPGNGLVRNVVMDAGVVLTIPSGYKITVNGTWSGGNSTVTGAGNVEFTSATASVTGSTSFSSVLSVVTGAILQTNNSLIIGNGGSLMHGVGTTGAGGSVVGNVIVRRSGNASSTSYNYWSSPITSASTGVLFTNRYMYDPNAATGTDVDGLRAGWINPGSFMSVGRGYIATGTANASFVGTPNNGALTFGPLTQGSFTSFNLVGNPYPSAISAASFTAANPNLLGGALYFWDDDNSSGADYAQTDYGVWNSVGFVGPNSGNSFNGNIASAQGFFVEASSAASITFNNSMRTTQNNEFFETTQMDRLWVNIVTADGNYNETLIAFKPDASDGVDQQFDAKKLRGNDQLSLYSRLENDDYAIQALADLTEDKVVQLGVDAAVTGNQTFSLKQIEGLDISAQVILEDTKLGTFTNLRTSESYSYVFTPEVDKFRFRLHFKPGVTFTTSTESCVQNDGELMIQSPSATTWSYVVQNAQGVQVASAENFSGNATISNLDGGIYTVLLSNAFGTHIHQAVEVAQGAPVSAIISASATVVDLNQGAIQFQAQTQGANEITWDFGDGSIVSGVLTPTHIYTLPGTYVVNFIASNVTCMDVQTMEITVKDVSTGISNTAGQVFSMYPNPANSVASIRMNLDEKEAELSVFILDAAGKLVQSQVFKQVDKAATLQLDVSQLAAGVYQILINGNKVSSSTRLTISR